MKNLKTITLGMMCLFGVSVMAIEPNGTAEDNSTEATAVKECYFVYNECDGLYPDSYSDFDACMGRGGC